MTLISRALVGAAFCALAPLASAQALQVLGTPEGVTEIDLYDTKPGGNYLKSVASQNLSFPLPIVEERALGFIVRFPDGNYYVGASDIVTNKEYDTTALCDSSTSGPTGASRGIAGLGCK